MHQGNKTIQLVSVLVLAALLVPPAATGAGMKSIDTTGLRKMIVDNAYRLEGGRAQTFTIVDARTREEYDTAHIFSAISVPSRDVEELRGRLPKNTNAALVVYDDGANREIEAWVERASALGYTNIAVYQEGFSIWKQSGMPVAPLDNSR